MCLLNKAFIKMNENKTKKYLILDEFYSIAHASRKLNLTRKTIYKIINSDEVGVRAKNMIEKSGYCSKTFKPKVHTP